MIPRLTAKNGEKEIDEKRDKEKKEEREQEIILKKEIARRRKERCKKRGKEIHEHEDEIENNKQKRRKINENVEYNTVIQIKSRLERIDDQDEKEKEVGGSKRRKVTIEKEEYKVKIVGRVIKGMVIEGPIDWKERRKMILERLEREEEDRKARIEKAARLNKTWELMRICREIIKENANAWIERKDKLEKKKEEIDREERRSKARSKKREFTEKEEAKSRVRKITDMLSKIPVVEAEKIEREIRKGQNLELTTMKSNL